jgi:hypothetical protein
LNSCTYLDSSTERTASCHVGQTGTHLINKVKQRWAQLLLGGVTRESVLGVPVGRCFRPRRTWYTACQRLHYSWIREQANQFGFSWVLFTLIYSPACWPLQEKNKCESKVTIVHQSFVIPKNKCVENPSSTILAVLISIRIMICTPSTVSQSVERATPFISFQNLTGSRQYFWRCMAPRVGIDSCSHLFAFRLFFLLP